MRTYRERIERLETHDGYVPREDIYDILDEIETYVDSLKYLIDDYEIKQARTKLAELGEELY